MVYLAEEDIPARRNGMSISVTGVTPQWTIGDRLRKARELIGIDRAEFAEQIGISRNTVTNYEHDKVKPRVVVLRAWAMRCGVAEQWIRSGQPPFGPSPGQDVNFGWSTHRRVGHTAVTTIGRSRYAA